MKKILCALLSAAMILGSTAVFADEPKTADILYQRTTLHRDGQDYDTAAIPDEAVSLLLNAAFTAPSGGNQLSNNYYVITDRALMQTIQEGHPYSKALNTAPLVIVVAGDEANCKYPELLEMDAGLAAMAMQVQATELGMSSCVMSIYPQDERVNAVRKATGMPETMKPVLMVSFGYPAADATSGASVNNYDESKVHYNFTEPEATAAPAEAADAVSGATALDTADTLDEFLSILTQETTNWNFLEGHTIPDADMQTILLAGTNTASAVNEQPWKIVVVTDKDMIAELADTDQTRHASAMILVFVTNTNEMKILDAGLATQSMQIAARALGYATKIETAPARTIRKDETGKYAGLFGIPEDKSARAALFIGYADADADAASSASVRVPMDEVVTYYTGK